MIEANSILWIEDEIGTIRGTLRRLKRLGCDVVVCENVSCAEKELNKRRFDRIIVDYQIPKNENEDARKGIGLELVRIIISDDSKHHYYPSQVMLLTAQMATFKRQMELSEAEGFSVLEKPGSLPKIEEWLQSKEVPA